MTSDPRSRRSPFAPSSAAAAAAALEAAADGMRSAYLDQPAPVDEPPTGLLDLAAIRAALGAEPGGAVNPAAVAWLAGEAEPEQEPVPFDEWVAQPCTEHAMRLDGTCAICGERLELDEPEPAPTSLREHFDEVLAAAPPVEYVCLRLPNGYHSDGPCGPAQHPEPPAPVPVSPQPAPAPTVTPPGAAPVFILPERSSRSLDWRSRHDERSLLFGVRPRLFGSAPLTDHELPLGPVLDQGSEGACFGYAGTAARNTLELLAGRPARFGEGDALELYRLAQRRDEVPGENYTGTSVTGGMAAGVELGCWGGYLWDFGTRDVAQTILKLQRPVIVGVRWLSGMYDTGPGGLVTLTGDDEGLGHCLSVFGIRLKGPQGQSGPFFGWQNSWGAGYGADGVGWVHHRDLAALLHGTGEAAVPTTDPVAPGGAAR